MPLENTVQNYLKTINTENPGITCPACGSILGIRRQGSTEMVLTGNARLELDGYVASYRRYLEKLEMLLQQRNVYYKAYPGNYPFARELTHYRRNNDSVEFNKGGIYKGVVAESVIEQLIKELDFFEWIENFYSFPSKRLDRQNLSQSEAQSIYQKSRDILLTGLEPRSIAGPLIDLIFDQKYVADWREKIILSNSKQNFDNFLKEICPAIQSYLQILLQMNQQVAANQPGGTKNSPDQNLEDGIIRVQFILAIMLGHRSQENNAFLENIFISYEVPFTLPRKTVVSPKYLQELLCSEIVLGNPQIGLNKDLLNELKQETKGVQGKSIDHTLTKLRSEIYKFVHFTCTGPVSEKLNQNQAKNVKTQQGKQNENNQIGEINCGWYPKLEETHPVILLGSPGSSKSSVMLTGFNTFYDNISALGATISFDSPEDEEMMKRLNEDYWVGKMPKPTKEGSRTTIKLSVEFPEKGYPRSNFVFTDIAGEVMARSLTHKGSDPAVLRILKNAETIIFFFDISIEPSIRKKLTEGDDGTWKVVAENYERIRKSRSVDPNNHENNESRVEVSQLQLLQKLIQDLRMQRGAEDLQTSDINFICVIPKMDLFTNQSNSDRYFFSDFIKELKDRDILVRSNRSQGDESFDGLRSLGGTLAKLPNNEKGNVFVANNSDSSVSNQKQLAKWFSERTLHYLNKIGNALHPETANPIKASLQKTLDIGLVTTLHYVFGQEKVYFIPVSAQGKDSESLELGNPPNQKLSEYVFILPVVLSVDETKSNRLNGKGSRTSPNPQVKTTWFGSSN